jgi:hypothetical protein
MGLISRIRLGVALCLLGLVSPLVCATAPAAPRQPAARLVAVEGAAITYGLKDYNGRVVTAVVPSQSSADIQWRSTDAIVHVTVASVDRATNRVKVVTHEGQILVLEMSLEVLTGMQIGDTVRRPKSRRGSSAARS